MRGAVKTTNLSRNLEGNFAGVHVDIRREAYFQPSIDNLLTFARRHVNNNV